MMVSRIGALVAASPTLPTREERVTQRFEIVSRETLADERNPLEGLAEIVVHLMVHDRPLEALEAAQELEDFLSDLRADLVSNARTSDPSSSWQSIADALGVSKQAALQKYGSRNSAERRGRIRPGPTHESAECEFVFDVNRSFCTRNSPITIPRECEYFIERHLLERVKGESIALTLIAPDGTSVSARLRYSENRGGGYFQLNAPRGSIHARLGEPLKVKFISMPRGHARVELRRLHRLT